MKIDVRLKFTVYTSVGSKHGKCKLDNQSSKPCPLTGDLKSFACVRMWVHGQWRKRYGSGVSIFLFLNLKPLHLLSPIIVLVLYFL